MTDTPAQKIVREALDAMVKDNDGKPISIPDLFDAPLKPENRRLYIG